MIMMLMMLILLVLLISILMYGMNLIMCKKMKLMRVKNSSFECGFEMFESIRLPFSIHFFLIGVLFLIFDIEIIYLFVMINIIDFMSLKLWLLISVMILLILLMGLEFEKTEGSLKWFI